MLSWFSRWFVTPRRYAVWIWMDHRWVPAGIVEARDYGHARRQAYRQNPGWQIQLKEVE